MHGDFENVLVIDIGDIYSRAFLFHQGEDPIALVEQKKVLSSLKKIELIEALRLAFKGKYNRVEVIGDKREWFGNSIRAISENGTTVGILIENQRTLIEYSSFGRLIKNKTLPFGIGQGMNKLMVSEGLDWVKTWLKVTQDTPPKVSGALNQLGNYSLYPTLGLEAQGVIEAILGALRYIFNQIYLFHSFYIKKAEVVGIEAGLRRVVLSGEIFDSLSCLGDIVLAVLDGLLLEGAWEILLDQDVVLPAAALGKQETKMSLENLKLMKLGSVLTLSHQHKWGESLGELNLDLGLSENQKLPLRSGEIIRIPFAEDEKGTIGLRVKPDVEVKGYEDFFELSGGNLGLIIDVRGRPLSLLDEIESYKDFYPHWKEALS